MTLWAKMCTYRHTIVLTMVTHLDDTSYRNHSVPPGDDVVSLPPPGAGVVSLPPSGVGVVGVDVSALVPGTGVGLNLHSSVDILMLKSILTSSPSSSYVPNPFKKYKHLLETALLIL